MADLQDLYQEVIFDHNRHPRNYRKLPDANHKLEGYNPLCGDKITLYLKVADGVIQDVAFEGSGCAISTASASLMTESVKGKRVEEAEALYEGMHRMLTGGTEPANLGKLAVLSGVRSYPTRVKCATLAWHTLHGALKDSAEPVSTE